MVNGLNLGVSIFAFIVGTILWNKGIKARDHSTSGIIMVIASYLLGVINMWLAF